jgi:hypothetical protein
MSLPARRRNLGIQARGILFCATVADFARGFCRRIRHGLRSMTDTQQARENRPVLYGAGAPAALSPLNP